MEERAAAPGFHSMNGMQHQPAFFTQRLRSNNKKIKIKNKKRERAASLRRARNKPLVTSQTEEENRTLHSRDGQSWTAKKLDAVLSLMQVETVKVHQGEIPTSPTITSRNKTVGGGGTLSLSLKINIYTRVVIQPVAAQSFVAVRSLASNQLMMATAEKKEKTIERLSARKINALTKPQNGVPEKYQNGTAKK
jgi:hypothetical protein